MFLRRDLLRLSGQLSDRILVGAGFGLAVTACDIGQAFCAAHVITAVIKGASFSSVSTWLLAIAAILVLRALLIFGREVAARKTGYIVKRRVRDRIFGHLIALGPGALMADRTGNMTAVAVESVEHLEPYCARYLPTFAVAVLGTLFVVGYIAWWDIWLAASLLVFMLLTPFLPLAWCKRLEPRNQERWRLWSDLLSEFVDSIQGITTLKLFNAAERRSDLLRNKSIDLYRAQMLQLYMALLVESFTVLTTVGGAAFVISLGALFVAFGRLDIATLLLILLIVREAFRPWVELSTYWHLGINASSGAEKIVRFLATQPVLRVPPVADGAFVEELRPSIEFDNVGFSYQTRAVAALSGIKLSVAPGETIGIVGQSGSGKSTLVSLLLRFFDPSEGEIRIGGRPIQTLALDALRRHIALVSQDTYLFAGTIRDNIALGKSDATEADIARAARDANIADFIAGLPQGYDTQVGERGLALSGGQRQRIAIARAFLKDAPILVLDEATSNVDMESEGAIQEALARLAANRTTLVVAHRLSTIREADRIIVLEAGCIAAQGSHAELMARSSAYSSLVEAQEAVA
jgi:ABC-type multidrug transport system fused ATPase/permease subunit